MRERFAGLFAWLFAWPLFVAALLFAAGSPRLASAQEIDCGANDKEVRSLHFAGNETLSDDELSIRVLTTPSTFTSRYFGWFFGAGVRRCLPDGLAPDVRNLEQFYQDNGFYRVKVDTQVTPAGRNAVDVTFRIVEGAPSIVDSLSITGLDSVANHDEILRDLQLRPGQRFGRIRLYADIDTIAARLRNSGYPRAVVFPGYNAGPTTTRADAFLNVVTGARARFGSIAVQRTAPVPGREPDIDSAVVLGLLAFRSGNWYSDRAVAESIRNLYNLGTFRHVGMDLDTTSRGSDTLANVVVDVREDFTRQINAEEGWATLDCFRVEDQYTDKNFADRAWRLDLTGRVSKLGYGAPTGSRATRNLCYRSLLDQDSVGSSKLNYYAGASLRQPSLFGGHWIPAYSLYTERRGEYRAYLRTTYVGNDFSATRNIGDRMPLRVGYALEFGQTTAEPAFLCAIFSACDAETRTSVQTRQPFGVASVAFQRTRTDNLVAPRSGYSFATEARTSAAVLGSAPDLRFFKLTGDLSVYRPLASRITFMARFRAGLVALGQTAGTKLPPPQERLYAGGSNSVRGFRQNELGALVYLVDSAETIPVRVSADSVAFVAKDGAGARRTIPVGGNTLGVINVELRIRDPFFPDLFEYVPFVDAGELFTEGGTQVSNVKRLYVTPGLGLRYFSPVGPIQANMGYNPSRSRAGPAYWSPRLGANNKAPLICVTGLGAPLVPVHVDRVTGDVDDAQGSTSCPDTFVPLRSNSFFRRLTFTFSIGTSF